MADEAEQDEAAPKGPGRLTKTALRVIDAWLRSLQSLRNRLEPPAPDDGARGSKKSGEPADGEPAAAPPHPKTLLHRALIVLMCLLIGGAAGGLFAYRGYSKLLDSRQALIENMQIEISESRKIEERSLAAKDKARTELANYRKQVRELQLELETSRGQTEAVRKQSNDNKRVERPAAPATRAGAPVPARPSARLKGGTCITGGTDPAGKLLECLDKFNQP